METFLDVCPLLDLMEGTTNYTQHVTISSDLQLTTRNLPDTVSGDNTIILHSPGLDVHRFLVTVTCVVLVAQTPMLSEIVRPLSLAKSMGYMHLTLYTAKSELLFLN